MTEERTTPKDGIIIKAFPRLSAGEVYEILKARFKVFYCEQRCYYLDMDDIDYDAIHISLYQGGEVIGYARLFKRSEKNAEATWLVGRMLSTERNKGNGKRIMSEVIDEAKRQGAQRLMLHAQIQAVPFYEKLGFHKEGEEFIEADIPHIMMIQDIQSHS